MGQSTDAMLVYGYVWDDEYELFEGDEEREWPEILARKRGIPNPWDALPPEIDDPNSAPYAERRAAGQAWCAAHRAELDAWSAAKRAIENESSVTIDQHGSGEWSCPIVRIKNEGWVAARGYPQDLTGAALTSRPDWSRQLDAFCEELGIDTSGAEGPGWFLASWWG